MIRLVGQRVVFEKIDKNGKIEPLSNEEVAQLNPRLHRVNNGPGANDRNKASIPITNGSIIPPGVVTSISQES